MVIKTVDAMLKRLEAHPDVTGLIRYGSDHQEDNYSVGDYDLFVVFFSWQPLVESLHFRVGHTPVDLNLITLETLAGLAPAFTFPQLALGDAALIFDRTEQVEAALTRLQKTCFCSTSRTSLGARCCIYASRSSAPAREGAGATRE